jgi:hypothetical protein
LKLSCSGFQVLALWQVDLHHTGKHGRGLSGAFRDDRFVEICCRICHRKAENKRTGTRWTLKEDPRIGAGQTSGL